MDMIVFIGGGNMVVVIIGGLVVSGWVLIWIMVVDLNVD